MADFFPPMARIFLSSWWEYQLLFLPPSHGKFIQMCAPISALLKTQVEASADLQCLFWVVFSGILPSEAVFISLNSTQTAGPSLDHRPCTGTPQAERWASHSAHIVSSQKLQPCVASC